MIAEALHEAMAGEPHRTFGLSGHPFLPMYVMNLGDRPGLLVDVELPPGAAIEDGQGFDIVEVTRSGRRSVLVRPTRAGIATPAFVGLVELVYRETAAAETRDAAVYALIGAVDEFRRFFARRVDRLSESALRGLFVELELLIELMRAGIAVRDALLAWAGPYRATDFKFADGTAIEVKSARVPPKAVEISSEHQLDAAPDTLHLFVKPVATLAPHDQVGTTFLEIVGEAKSLISKDSGAMTLWTSAVEALGFDESDPYYAQWRFASNEWQIYHVLDGFPRITRDSLPVGVRAVSYSLQLEALEPFRDDSASLLAEVAASYV